VECFVLAPFVPLTDNARPEHSRANRSGRAKVIDRSNYRHVARRVTVVAVVRAKETRLSRVIFFTDTTVVRWEICCDPNQVKRLRLSKAWFTVCSPTNVRESTFVRDGSLRFLRDLSVIRECTRYCLVSCLSMSANAYIPAMLKVCWKDPSRNGRDAGCIFFSLIIFIVQNIFFNNNCLEINISITFEDLLHLKLEKQSEQNRL